MTGGLSWLPSIDAIKVALSTGVTYPLSSPAGNVELWTLTYRSPFSMDVRMLSGTPVQTPSALLSVNAISWAMLPEGSVWKCPAVSGVVMPATVMPYASCVPVLSSTAQPVPEPVEPLGGFSCDPSRAMVKPTPLAARRYPLISPAGLLVE